jgi:hypothetical protein
MNAFLLDIQWKNDTNATPRDRIYWNPRLSVNHMPRIFILQRQITNRMRMSAIIYSGDSTTHLRLVLEFSSSWIIGIIIPSLKNESF